MTRCVCVIEIGMGTGISTCRHAYLRIGIGISVVIGIPCRQRSMSLCLGLCPYLRLPYQLGTRAVRSSGASGLEVSDHGRPGLFQVESLISLTVLLKSLNWSPSASA